ncbi:MAG: hypothetical protein ACI9W3_001228, partial [Marinoscillum sp.]
RFILCAGAGGYSSTRLFETEGTYLAPSEQTPEGVLAHFDEIADISKQCEYQSGSGQGEKFLKKAMAFLKSQA